MRHSPFDFDQDVKQAPLWLQELIESHESLPWQRRGYLRQAMLDLRNPQWWQALHLPRRALAQPLFMLCEGVLMYLQPAQVRQVLREFATQAPAGSRLLIATLSQCAVGQAGLHASVCRTGAQFHWGIRHMRELTDCQRRCGGLAYPAERHSCYNSCVER